MLCENNVFYLPRYSLESKWAANTVIRPHIRTVFGSGFVAIHEMYIFSAIHKCVYAANY
jgi:hypothetical protein